MENRGQARQGAVVPLPIRQRLVGVARRLGSGPLLAVATVGGAALLAEGMRLLFWA